MEVIYLTRINVLFESSASANRVRSLLEGLAALGVKVSIIVTDGYITKRERQRYKSEGNDGPIHFIYLSYLVNETLFQRRLNKYFLLPLINVVSAVKVKRILTNNRHFILWTAAELKYFKIVVNLKKHNPTIYTFLELNEYLDYQNYTKSRTIHLLEGKIRQWYFEKRAFTKYNSIALMTGALVEYYQTFNKPIPRLLHLPMTVDLNRFRKIMDVDQSFIKPYIAYAGMMNNDKDGVDILIHSFALVANSYKDYKLYLIGGWNYDTPYHLKLIKELSLEDRVIWKGSYDRDQIPAIIGNASLLALPRPRTKQTEGGFPTKLGEYLATGNPVCATCVGEIPKYLTDNESVYFADPGSIDSFAKAIQRALSDPARAQMIGLKGRKVAEEHFNMCKQATVLKEFLQFEMSNL